MEAVKAAINGNETAGGEGTPLGALSDFYRAFNGRDLERVMANWADDEGISMDNPLGGIKRGREEVAEVYRRIFSGPARVYVEFYDYTIHAAQGMFYAVGRERGSFIKGEVKIDLAIRTSRIFRRSEKGWRQVHHHGSIEEPRLLDAYQKAVGLRGGNE
ncbi:MAG: nuclear transport factor 2 family protein [Nitrospinae bacterium]|nr:nuclear transport factor 2 family protein [Nitrospinota bacterium]